MMFVKLSIGVFLLRLATKRVYIWTIRIALVIVTLWSLGIFIWDIFFQCTPVQRQWDFRITSGHCAGSGEIRAAIYALSAMTVLSDWFFVSNLTIVLSVNCHGLDRIVNSAYLQALIPIPMLWEVKMNKQAKATVIVILGLGVLLVSAMLFYHPPSGKFAVLISQAVQAWPRSSDSNFCQDSSRPTTSCVRILAPNDKIMRERKEKALTRLSFRDRRNHLESGGTWCGHHCI